MKVHPEDLSMISVILDRLERELPQQFDHDSRPMWANLMVEVHAAVPLDLTKMSMGRLSDLAHDMGGLYRHWDTRTQSFRECFWPRFAKQQ